MAVGCLPCTRLTVRHVACAAATTAVSTKPPEVVISYATDVEGNYEYWRSFVGVSEVLTTDADDRVVFKDDVGNLATTQTHFVFGGDLCDKGNGDIRVGAELIDLKDRHPDRVHLILGNRDVNKMRLASELSPSEYGGDTLLEGYPRVSPLSKLPSNGTQPKDFLAARIARADNLASPDDVSCDKIREWNTGPNRLKYILRKTMGSPDTFEFRRDELALLWRLRHGKHRVSPAIAASAFAIDGVAENPTGEDVLASYLHAISDGGFLRQYLDRASVAVALGSSLFVHGGIDASTLLWVPPLRPTGVDADDDGQQGHYVEELATWVAELNGWARANVDAWVADPGWKGGRSFRAGIDLVRFGGPYGVQGKTVIYKNFLDDGHPAPLCRDTMSGLASHGIQRLVVGHQPHGDAPTVIRSPRSIGVDVVMGDTSYSDVSADDNRGKAVSEVLIRDWGGGVSEARCHGVGADGADLDYTVGTTAANDPLIGRETRRGWWVTSRLADGSVYLVTRGAGFKLEQRWLGRDALDAAL